MREAGARTATTGAQKGGGTTAGRPREVATAGLRRRRLRPGEDGTTSANGTRAGGGPARPGALRGKKQQATAGGVAANGTTTAKAACPTRMPSCPAARPALEEEEAGKTSRRRRNRSNRTLSRAAPSRPKQSEPLPTMPLLKARPSRARNNTLIVIPVSLQHSEWGRAEVR